ASPISLPPSGASTFRHDGTHRCQSSGLAGRPRPPFTLIGFQDDATGQVLSAHFQLEPENTVGYLRALQTMILTHGIPLSLYRDRHSIFQRNDSHWTLAEQLAG